MAAYSGFAEEEFDTVFIILDKMDKIGLEGVAEELAKEGMHRKRSINICHCSQVWSRQKMASAIWQIL